VMTSPSRASQRAWLQWLLLWTMQGRRGIVPRGIDV
jgi:hypothetical protein